MSAVAADSLSEGQQEALAALHSIARLSDGALMVDLDYEQLLGVLTVRVYLSFASLIPSEQGTKLEDREPIDILIPDDFPYRSAIAWVGRDHFPRIPHQPRGSRFCVRVEKSNWDPTAGMPGFMRAVIETYQHIALGALEGHLQSWRPTDHYLGQDCAVIRADLPATDSVGPGTSLRWAAGTRVSEDRIDIIEWLDISEKAKSLSDLTKVLGQELARINDIRPDSFLIPAVISPKHITLEYFRFWIVLLNRLQRQGADSRRLLGHLARAAAINESESGGPERAAVLFRVAADTGLAVTGQDARFAVARLTPDDVRLLSGIHAGGSDADSAEQMRAEFVWAPVPWLQVYDARPESVLRRATHRDTRKLAGARILLLGCGGLGAPIAEHCVRSRAAYVRIVDAGKVSPGVLSRQPYEDADIGKPKAEVLADRLARIYPENEVTGSFADILFSDIFGQPDLGEYNLIIDATANRSVAAKIERAQRDEHNRWPALATVAISQYATHGVAAVTPRGAVGAGIDLLRRLGLKTCRSTALGDVYAAFFPPRAERLNFRPDANCSDTTFIGSTTDMSALAAQLLNGALAHLDLRPDAPGATPPHRSLSIVRLGSGDDLRAARVVFDLPPDRVIVDHGQTYEVRVDETAMETICDNIRASVNGRTPGAGHTRGLLLGQFDSTCRIAWVSQAMGLPRESTASPLRVVLGLDKVRRVLGDRSRQSGGMVTLIGSWRTHLSGSAAPSETDRTTMQELLASPECSSGRALLLVFGGPEPGSTYESASPWEPEIHAEIFTVSADVADEGH